MLIFLTYTAEKDAEKLRTINPYGPTFDDADPACLNQIVTVLVHKADKFVSTAIEEILAPVGKVLLSYIDYQGNNAVLKAVTLSNRPTFITELEVPITPQISFTLRLDYEGLQLRCRLCLSVAHSALDCPHRHPSPNLQQPRDTGLGDSATRRPPVLILTLNLPTQGWWRRNSTDVVLLILPLPREVPLGGTIRFNHRGPFLTSDRRSPPPALTQTPSYKRVSLIESEA
ncbi:hypothetical protein R1sor_011753 [Riccia sorocarpa]|uniref:Zinc knuckle CX2CX4HX4C domain-containing protein n=1 Tax=Riccia sorocarpa TaxID=122646 RepID=A0ABD3I5S0_9MARC